MREMERELEDLLLQAVYAPGHTPHSSWYDNAKEKLLRWHERWSGRPSREQIKQMLKGNLLRPNFDHKNCMKYEMECDLVEDILALYPAPAPVRKVVSREEIESVLEYHGICVCGKHEYFPLIRHGEGVSDKGKRISESLLALLSPGEKKPVDCCCLKHPHHSGRCSECPHHGWK